MYMLEAETQSESNVNRRIANFASSPSDIAGGARRGTAQWQHARLTAREMCNRFSVWPRAFALLLRGSLSMVVVKKLAAWVIAVTPRSLTVFLRHVQCPQCVGRRIPNRILKRCEPRSQD